MDIPLHEVFGPTAMRILAIIHEQSRTWSDEQSDAVDAAVDAVQDVLAGKRADVIILVTGIILQHIIEAQLEANKERN